MRSPKSTHKAGHTKKAMDRSPKERAYKVTFKAPADEYDGGKLVQRTFEPSSSLWQMGIVSQIASEGKIVVYRKNGHLYSCAKGTSTAWASDTLSVQPFWQCVLSVTRVSGGRERLRRHFGDEFAMSKTLAESDEPISVVRFGPSLGAYTTAGSTTVFSTGWRSHVDLFKTTEPVDWALWLSTYNEQIASEGSVGTLTGVLLYGTRSKVRVYLGEAQAVFLAISGSKEKGRRVLKGEDVLSVDGARAYIARMQRLLEEQAEEGLLDVRLAPPEAAQIGEGDGEPEQLFYVLTREQKLFLVCAGEAVRVTMLSDAVRFYKTGKAGLVVYRDATGGAKAPEAAAKSIVVSFYAHEELQELLLEEDEQLTTIDASFEEESISVYYTSR